MHSFLWLSMAYILTAPYERAWANCPDFWPFNIVWDNKYLLQKFRLIWYSAIDRDFPGMGALRHWSFPEPHLGSQRYSWHPGILNPEGTSEISCLVPSFYRWKKERPASKRLCVEPSRPKLKGLLFRGSSFSFHIPFLAPSQTSCSLFHSPNICYVLGLC